MKIGIWIDTKEAFIIAVDNTTDQIQHVMSNIDTSQPKGGSRSNVPYGPVQTVSESKFREKRMHQEDAFFELLLEKLDRNVELMIFGPAQAKNKLEKHIVSSKDNKITILDCLQADSMTQPQMVAFVKKYYNLLKSPSWQ